MSRASYLLPQARWLAVFLLAGAALPGRAAEEPRTQLLALDDARSYVDFEVKVLWLVGVHGRFNNVHGTVAVDRFRNSATVDVRIGAASVTMRNKGHEEWVKSPEFFDTEHFPEIQFVSESIPLKRLQSGGEIDGMLTLRGVSKPAKFELSVPNCARTNDANCPVEAEGSIRRSEFGMSSRRAALADKVDLSFSIYTAPLSSDPNR